MRKYRSQKSHMRACARAKPHLQRVELVPDLHVLLGLLVQPLVQGQVLLPQLHVGLVQLLDLAIQLGTGGADGGVLGLMETREMLLETLISLDSED